MNRFKDHVTNIYARGYVDVTVRAHLNLALSAKSRSLSGTSDQSVNFSEASYACG